MMSGLAIHRLTARGRGAVAVIRVAAKEAHDAMAVDRCFRPVSGTVASTSDIGRILYGHWGAEDVVVVRTDSRAWEIYCHGGEAAVSRIISDLKSDSTPDALSTASADSLQAQLLKCTTQCTARFLLAQQQGVLSAFCERIQQSLTTDEVLPMTLRFLAWQIFAAHLTEPWQVAIVGRPNAGKSSLLNAMAGYARAIVCDEPGTTRDRVETEITFQGWPFRLIDTAGVRQKVTDTIEAQGVAQALNSVSNCDACLLVVDCTTGWTEAEDSLLAVIPASCPVAVLWNKIDLPGESSLPPGQVCRFSTSASTRAGIDEVLTWISQTLIPEIPPLSEPLPVLSELTVLMSEFARCQDLQKLQTALPKVSRYFEAWS